MSQALARKWRPKTFQELVGQEHVIRALTNALTQQRLHHAYLFTGTRGVGKTTLARIIAKAMNCESGITAQPCGQCSACIEIDSGRFVDLLELDAASNTQVDNMRELLDNAVYAPTSGRFKVYIIDEVHMLSRNAFNAMLKTLEEPPAHLKFILATTDPQKIPVTVLSRCLQFNLKQIPVEQIVLQLKKILELEQVEYEPQALTLLARAARGSMRDGLSLLDQAIAHGGGKVVEQAVRLMLGSVERKYLYELMAALGRNDGAAMIAVADRMAEHSLSFETALIELAALLHRIALAQAIPAAQDSADGDAATINEFAASFSAEDIQLWYDIVLRGRQDIALAPDDYAGFTMTLMRLLAFAPASESSQPRAATGPGAAVKSAPPELKKKLIVADWNSLVNQLPLVGMERMLAHNCELVACDDERIELRIPHAQRHLNDRAYHERLKQALEQHFGAQVKLDISVGVGNGNTVAEVQNRENQQRKAQAEAEIEADPFVRDLVENLDARVLSATLKAKGASQ